MTSGLRLLVVVPCRDEARVIGRRITNLAQLAWPAGTGHRLIVVDDGSLDATLPLARAALSAWRVPGVEAEVCGNPGPPGKPGALRCALEAGASDTDLAVLTDADVLLERDAFLHLTDAFEREPDLAMACGAQRFARRLPADGAPELLEVAADQDASGAYDRVTDWVRALESRVGRVFSVHGQLLAWRTALDLTPRDGIAADDLDLRLALGARGRAAGAPWRVRRIPAAVFHEEKPGPKEREGQATRRARAYLQVLRRSTAPPWGDFIGRVQWLASRSVPFVFPELLPFAAVASVAGAWALWGMPAALTVAVALTALFASPLGRRLIALRARIAAAVALEERGTLEARWEMARR